MDVRTLGRGGLSLAFAFVSALTGCGDGDESPPSLAILSFEATPNSVSAGESVQLAWRTSGATQVIVQVEGGGTLIDTPNGAGSVSFGPLVDTTNFSVTAIGRGDAEVSRTLTVQVAAAARPVIDRFTASATDIVRGDTVTLDWATTNAETVDITTNGGVPVIGAGAASGTVQVQPTDDAIYTLTARGPDGQITLESVTVNVSLPPNSEPTVEAFEVSPDIIDFGGQATLSWTLTGVTPMNIIIRAMPGGTIFSGTDLTNSRTVSPTENTVYTLEATNEAGMVMATESLSVNPPRGARIVDFSVNPVDIAPGDQATLSWTTEEAVRVLIVADGATIVDSTDLTGTVPVSPLMTTTYTLTAFGIDFNATATETLTVTPVTPTIVAFAASPSFVVSNSTTTLSWSVMDADTITVRRGGDLLVTTSSLTGQLTAAVGPGVNTFTLNAANPGRQAEQTVEVFGADVPVINAFAVVPSSVVGTTTVAVTWDVDNVQALALTANGTPVPGFAAVTTSSVTASSGTLTATVTFDTVFELTASSPLGTRTATRAVDWTPALVTDTEPNNTSSTAQTLSVIGGTVVGQIGTATDEDWYRVPVPEAGNLFAETTDGAGGCAFDTVVTIFAPDGSSIIEASDDEGIERCSRIDPLTRLGVRNMTAGTYFIRVQSFANATGDYVLTVRVAGPACGNRLLEPSVGEQCDDNNTQGGDGCSSQCQFEAERTFTAPGGEMTFSDPIDPVADIDVVRFTVTATAYLAADTFTTATSSACRNADTLIAVYDAQGGFIGEDDASGIDSCAKVDPARATWARLNPGDYWVVVREDGDDATIANVDLQLEGRPVDICGNGVIDGAETCDDGDTVSNDGCSATCTLELAGSYTAPGPTSTVSAALAQVGDIDVFEVTVTSTAFLSVETLSDAASGACTVNTELTLRDSAGQLIAYDDDSGVNACTELASLRLGPGTYTLTVNERSNDEAIAQYDVVFRSAMPNACGNAVIEGTESCDDGNAVDGDGCSAQCVFEASVVAEAEPNNSLSSATPVAALTAPTLGRRTVRGTMGAFDEDYWQMVLPTPSFVGGRTYGNLGVPLSCQGDTILEIRNSTANVIAADDQGGAGDCSRIGLVAVPAGTYAWLVRSRDNRPISAYVLDLEVAAPTPPTVSVAEVEPNDTVVQGQAVTFAGGLSWQTVVGAFAANDSDVYTVTVAPGQTVTVWAATHDLLNDLATCPADTVLTVEDATGRVIETDDDGGFGGCSKVQLTLTGGVYNFRVVELSGAAVPSYRLSIVLL